MTADLIIDDDGEPWPLDSAELARRLGCRDLRLGLADFAVVQRGFIHIRPIETGVRVGLSPGAFSPVTLAGALQVLNDLSPRRILMVVGSGQDRMAELFTSIFEFVERAEQLACDPPTEVRVPHLSVPRGIENLATARFARVRPAVELWRQRKGELTEDVHRAMLTWPSFHRSILVRQSQRSRLVTEHITPGFAHIRPCEALLRLNRDFADMPDPEYGAWVAECYGEALHSRRLRLESVRSRIRTSAATTMRTRYDRILMPWWRKGDLFVMGLSLRREVSVAE